MDEGFSLSPEMAAGALLYGAILAAIGACAARWLIAPRLDAHEARHLERSAATIGLASAALAVLAQVLRAWTHTIAAFGLADAFVWENVRLIAIESRWGQSWLQQSAAAIVALAAFAAVRRQITGGWLFASFAAVAAAVTLPLIGHAAGSLPRMTVHAAHVLGGGLWIGTLTVLRHDVMRGDTPPDRFAALRGFALVAVTGVAILVIAGLLASSNYIGGFTPLVSGAYGRALILKVCIVLGALTCGYFNWRDLHGLRAPVHDALTRRVSLELALGVIVVAITGVLTELPHP